MFTLGNIGVMICLGQGGLRSPGASSCITFFLIALFIFIYFIHFVQLTPFGFSLCSSRKNIGTKHLHKLTTFFCTT